jgi:Spy/CpxP family protein refolding chaperone
MNVRTAAMATITTLAVLFTNVSAEDNAGVAPPPNNGNGNGAGGGGGNGGGQGRRNFDPAQFRQRMLDRIKEQLGFSDDEMKAIQPKLEAVQNLQQQTRGGMGGGFFRRRQQQDGTGNPPPPAPEPKTDLEKKSQELQTLLDNKDSDAKAISEKLKELRELREKAKGDLKKAQDELRELLTPRQEAQLVMMGLLD